ncbi:alpha-hydroxy acid oxidase [Kaistia dalseonensis]|uniref:L-lactate dehydrogenase (Cytochrome) n=1 Tax=Kaistia dalseonensis TaxID=410840 RepID=A0ABU0H860_9HYPH|nr:alpha-hydroxy acid oxidase [Kaistia dalseonensis]MCX5495482.1 alpha-hydroxy acid oxidase [Kaistia dalseonensis]MDQ0438073.1 L-lactate dehydrogenase (cytochrome) [Kaistia dalseonensis]
MKDVTSVEDLRLMAKRRVPRAFFEYCDRGSYSEETLDANRADLKALKLRQRVMVDVSNRSTETTILGEKRAFPFAFAPTGLTGMQHADGEILAARACEKANIPFCLSTMSICSIEDVAANTSKPFWFQLYVMKNRDFARQLVERAIAAKCSALVLTLDLQVQGQRHRDIKNGLTVPPRIKLGNVLDMATKLPWAFEMLGSKHKTFGNLAGRIEGMSGVKSLGQWVAGQFDATLNWNDVAWIRSIWPGKLILKGVLDVGDAKSAAATGADAIVVSNHGGRQLDGAPSAISTLPRIADAVGHQTEIMFDSGIRSGQDVLRALALGARSCLLGRAFLYGLGAGGEAGVSKAIDVIGAELDISMALTGRRTIAEIDETVIDRG